MVRKMNVQSAADPLIEHDKHTRLLEELEKLNPTEECTLPKKV
jgi:hypothetical protein